MPCMKQQLLSLQPIVKAGMAFIGGGHSGAASSTVTRFVLNEYCKARSTKNYGLHSPSPWTMVHGPKYKVRSPMSVVESSKFI